MADVKKTIEIIFAGADKVSGTIKTVTGNLDDLAGGVKDVSQPFADFAKAVLAFESAMGLLAVGGLAVAVKAAGDFGNSFAEISTLIDASAEDIDTFRRSILNYGRDASSSYADINAAVYTAISAGTDYKDSLDIIKISEQLAIGGRSDLESSTKLLSSTLNAYGESADSAEYFSDLLFQTVKDGQTTIPELGQTLSKVTGIAAAGGIPFETLAAAIATVTKSGAPTSEAITGIKAAIANIIKPTAEATKEAENLGIKFDASALQADGFEGVLQTVYEATGGNIEKMGLFFGSIEGLNTAMVLTKDSSSVFVEALSNMDEVAGNTEVAYKKMADNFALSNQHIINNMKATLIDVGTPLLDDYKKLADALSKVFQGISIGINSGAFDEVFNELNEFSKLLGEYLEGVAKAMPDAFKDIDWSELLKSFDGLGDSLKGIFAALFGDLDLTKPADLQIMIQKIVDSVTLLTNVSSGIIKSLTPLAGKIGEVIDSFVDSDEDMQDFIGNILGMGKAVNVLAGAVGVITGPLDVLANGFVTLAAIKYVGMASGITAVGSSFSGMVIGAQAATGSMIAFTTQATLLQKVGLVGMAATFGWMVGKLANEYVPGVKEAAFSLAAWTDKIFDWTGTQSIQNQLIKDADKAAKDLTLTFHKVPANIAIALTVDSDEAVEMQKILDEMPETKDTTIVASADISSFMEAYNELHGIVPDEKDVNVKSKVDAAAAMAAKEKIDEIIPTEKMLEITLQGDIDKQLAIITTSAQTVQTAMEWTAKVDIAKAEAQAEIMVAAFTSVDSTIQNTSDNISSLFGLMAGDVDMTTMWAMEDQIRAENKLREEAWIMQEKLLESQRQYNIARTDKLKSGDNVITVKGEGLYPHMKAFMWELLKEIQLDATAEGAEFLLGFS